MSLNQYSCLECWYSAPHISYANYDFGIERYAENNHRITRVRHWRRGEKGGAASAAQHSPLPIGFCVNHRTQKLIIWFNYLLVSKQCLKWDLLHQCNNVRTLVFISVAMYWDDLIYIYGMETIIILSFQQQHSPCTYFGAKQFDALWSSSSLNLIISVSKYLS